MNPSLLTWLGRHVDATHGSRITVVARRPLDPTDLSELAEVLGSGHVVHVVVFDGDLDRLHLQLLSLGRSDLVVDLCRGRKARERLLLLPYHLVHQGRLLIQLPAPGGSRDAIDRTIADVRSLQQSAAVEPPDRGPDTRPHRRRDLHALAASLSDVELDARRLTATYVAHTLTVVRETATNNLLLARPELGELVHEEPGAQWERTAGFVSTATSDEPLTTVSSPPLSLRRYHHVVCGPDMVAHAADVVLPDTFRDPLKPRLRTSVLVDWSPYAVSDPGLARTEHLEGHWFYLDTIMRGHFGHALTEQISRLWAWDRARQLFPDLRVLVPGGAQPVAEWQYALWEAAGVPRERVHAIELPVTVEHLVAATPGYAIGSYVHPATEAVYQRVARAFDDRAADSADPAPADPPRRIFLTRRHEKRGCRNREEVEALFVEHGFVVVALEELPLARQVRLVRSADVVAGFGGSAMFHLLFAPAPKRVMVISSKNYHLANERYLSAFKGHDLSVVRCEPDIQSRRFSYDSFHSSYSLDLEREGAWLRERLAALDAGETRDPGQRT